MADVAQRGDAKRRPLSELVARLRMLVVDGAIRRDVATDYASTASALAVDEGTARAVVAELGRDGFLESCGPDAYRVRRVEEVPEADAIELRRMLEPAAARGAAVLTRPVDLITLRALAEDVETAVLDCDYPAFRRAADTFMASVLARHPNAELPQLCADLRSRTPHDGLRVPVQVGVLGRNFRRQMELVELMEARDLDGVETLVRTHLDLLQLVGVPKMDEAHLPGPRVSMDPDSDTEFLDPA